MKRFTLIAALLLAAACATTQPPQLTPVVPVPTPIVVAVDATIVRVYHELLNRAPDPFGVEYYGQRLRDGRMDEAAMRADVLASPEYAALHSPKPWVTTTEAQLRSWCGSIATTYWDGPGGIRPGRVDNPIFTAEYTSSSYTAADRARMIAAYPYTHWAVGPMVQAGYSRYWPPTDFRGNPDAFLDHVETLWKAGKYPAIFLLDDTGVWSDGRTINRERVERELTPFYSQPRWQALARIVVPAWEPSWSAADWQWVTQWMARVFPLALRYVHFESGHGAPGLGSELAPNGPYASEGAMWHPIAPYIHGFLQQDSYAFSGDSVADGRTPFGQVLYDAWDFIRRFRDGYMGWPTRGAGGTPLDMVMFEYGSFSQFGGGPGIYGTFAEAQRQAYELGRLLLQVPGIAGIGDGGPCGVR